jgi:hypothetical protein
MQAISELSDIEKKPPLIIINARAYESWRQICGDDKISQRGKIKADELIHKRHTIT